MVDLKKKNNIIFSINKFIHKFLNINFIERNCNLLSTQLNIISLYISFLYKEQLEWRYVYQMEDRHSSFIPE